MTAAWWASHPAERDVVDAADGLVLAACARELGFGEAVEVPRYEVRTDVRPESAAIRHTLRSAIVARREEWPEGIDVPDLGVARVIAPDGRKRTCVVAVLRRGRVSRAIVVDTEAP